MRDDSRAKKHNSTPPYNPMNASTIYRREGNNNNQPRTSSSSTNNHQPPTTIDSTMSPPYYYLAPNTRSWSYQQNCITKPISSSAIGAIIFSALDVVQGRPVQVVFTPRAVGELVINYYFELWYIHCRCCCCCYMRPFLLEIVLCIASLWVFDVYCYTDIIWLCLLYVTHTNKQTQHQT